MSMAERLRILAEFDKRAKKGAQIAYRERALRLGLTEASAMNFLAATSCKIGHFYPKQRVVVKAKKNGERIMPRKGSIVAMRTRGGGPTLDVDWKVRLDNGPVVEVNNKDLEPLALCRDKTWTWAGKGPPTKAQNVQSPNHWCSALPLGVLSHIQQPAAATFPPIFR